MINFTKANGIIHVIISMIITIVLNRYYFGSLVILYTLMIGLHTLFSQELSSYKITQYTHIPAYTVLTIIIITSFFILYKSSTTELPQKIFTVIQLLVAILFKVFLTYGKQKFEILNETYINYVPTLFFLGFLISVSIIKDNQSILRKTYTETLHTVKKESKKEY